MVSCRQKVANRRNAQRSTGPRTQEGKARASQNALTHGLTSQDVVLPWEDPEEFAQLRDGLYQDLQPVGAIELHLVDTVSISIWRFQRIARIEAGVIEYEHYQAELDEILEAIGRLHNASDREFELTPPSGPREQMLQDLFVAGLPIQQKLKTTGPFLGLAFKNAEPTLRHLPRYEASIQKTLFTALRELKERQAERTSSYTRKLVMA